MKKRSTIRPDPLILNMTLSHVRNLISRLSTVHADLGAGHIGWANCECDLASILREFCDAIATHLGLPALQRDTRARIAKVK